MQASRSCWAWTAVLLCLLAAAAAAPCQALSGPAARATIREQGSGLGTSGVRPDLAPTHPYKLPVYFVRASQVAATLRGMGAFLSTRHLSIRPVDADNSLLVFGADDDVRALKDAIRLIDVEAYAIEVRAEAVIWVTDRAGRKSRVVLSVTGRGLEHRPIELRTAASPSSRSGTGSASLRVRLIAWALHSASGSEGPYGLVTLTGDWTLTCREPAGPGSGVFTHTASVSGRAASGATLPLDQASGPLGAPGRPEGSVAVGLSARPSVLLPAPAMPYGTSEWPWTTIMCAVHNRLPRPDRAATRMATDALAVMLAQTGRFEVLKLDDTERAAAELGLTPPFNWADLRAIATRLGATAVATGELVPAPQGGVVVRAWLRDALSGGVLVAEASRVGPGAARGEPRALAAAARAIAEAWSRSLRPTGTVVMTDGRKATVSLGRRDGVRAGTRMALVHEWHAAGELKVTSADATTCDAVLVVGKDGMQVGDTVLVVRPSNASPPRGERFR